MGPVVSVVNHDRHQRSKPKLFFEFKSSWPCTDPWMEASQRLWQAAAVNSAEIHYVSTCPIPMPICPLKPIPFKPKWTERQIQRSTFQTSNVGICSGATNSPTEDVGDACHSSNLSGQRRIETLPLLCPIKT